MLFCQMEVEADANGFHKDQESGLNPFGYGCRAGLRPSVCCNAGHDADMTERNCSCEVPGCVGVALYRLKIRRRFRSVLGNDDHPKKRVRREAVCRAPWCSANSFSTN